jgi:hypothetical protein
MQALNDREMPTAGSMLEAFNQQLVSQCGEAHAAALAAIHLPTETVSLTHYLLSQVFRCACVVVGLLCH